MIRSWAFNLFFYGFTLLTALVGIILVPIPTPVLLRGLLHHWARAVVWAARWIGGMKVEIRGRDNLPAKGPALLANKHQSESDGIFLAANIPGITFVAMQELFRYPLIGAILYRLQMIRVDTCGGGKEREHLAQFAKRAHDSGRHIAIYPEGNLMAPGERERYRSGIYYLYRDLGLPVTPVATSLGLLCHRVPARHRDRPRQARLHAPAGRRDRDGERPADRRVLRPALHRLAARPALARPDRRRPTAQRPSRSALTKPDMPTWRSRLSRSAVRIAFRFVRLVPMSLFTTT
jgi:1-acyl-sn-glycerol-3-phosphate acyltransferase